MLRFTAHPEGHEMMIYETGRDGQVTGLDFFCRSCDHNDVFDQSQYSKYRLATQAARRAAQVHTGLDEIVWSLS